MNPGQLIGIITGSIIGSFMIIAGVVKKLGNTQEDTQEDTENNHTIIEGHELIADWWINNILFSSNGKFLASTNENTVKLLDIENDKEIEIEDKNELFPKRRNKIISIAFSPDSKILAVNKEGTVYFWEVEKGRRIHIYEINVGSSTILFSPDSKFLITADSTFIVAWDLSSKNSIYLKEKLFKSSSNKKLGRKYYEKDSKDFSTIAFSPDGKKFASGNHSGEIDLWKYGTFKNKINSRINRKINFTYMKQIKTEKSINSIAFSSNSKLLVSGGKDGIIKLWNVEDGKLINELPIKLNKHHEIISIILSHDNKFMATMTEIKKTISLYPDTIVSLWDISNINDTYDIKHIKNFKKRGLYTNAIAFSPDSKILASGGTYNNDETNKDPYYNNPIIFWDISNIQTGGRKNINNRKSNRKSNKKSNIK